MENQTSEPADKKQYELSFLLLAENGVEGVLKLLSQHGAEVRAEGHLRKINLAYPIKKATQAYFGFVDFAGEPAEVKLLERDLESNAAVLRSLIIKLPKARFAPSGDTRKPAMKPTMMPSRKPMISTEAPKPKPVPLSNEALEKKIEEILQ
jgi:ribosomal protein S6